MSSNPYINNIYKRWKDIKEYVDTRIQFRSLIDKKEIKALLDEKQDKLIAGKNITIEDNVISAIVQEVDLSHIEEQINNLNTEVDEIKDTLENISTITKPQIDALFGINVVIFTAEEDNSSIGLESLSTNQTLEYSTDAANWTNMNTSTVINLDNVGDSVYVRGILSADNTYMDYTQFKMTGKISASGNCNALWNYQDLNAPLKEYCGYYMFHNCTSLTTAPELPAMELASYCYHSTFSGCTSLVIAPELPATTLADNCYYGMFSGCTSLTTAPELPATTLADNCYSQIFYNCTSLTTAPELPASTLASNCYSHMFYNCTSLTTAPELPATKLAVNCYSWMFCGCTALTTAPELSATTLAESCYNNMFYNCTSLTTAPELSATVLADSCYSSMFNGCISLTTAPELPATTLAGSCYYSMFWNCTSLVTPPELPATTLAEYCYIYMFTGCTSLTTAPELPATTLAGDCYASMFQGCSRLNYIKCLATDISAGYCTYDWVLGVASTGTFIKHPDMNDWTTGVNGIPIGWVVENADMPCVTFTAEEDNSSIGLTKLSTNHALKYSTDSSTWNTFDTTTNVSLNKGDEVYIRGILNANNSYSNFTQFKMTGKIAVGGNCNAIWNYEDLNAPLKNYCGYCMFRDCTSLVNAPELPATTLADSCYNSMFQGCTGLTTAPKLPATTLDTQCYSNMFRGCASLTTAPELPATTVHNNCYYCMFYNCTSLTTAPELPATTLDTQCYCSMFYGCTSLTAAPELPATTLASWCYYGMFYGCTSLNYIKCLATDISAESCISNWVNNVSPTGTFIKHPDMNDWTTGINGIPSGWTIEDYAG